jgi:hypothetical protein
VPKTSAVVTDREGVRQHKLFARQGLEACEPIPVVVELGKAHSQVLFGEEVTRNALLVDRLLYCLISVQKGMPAGAARRLFFGAPDADDAVASRMTQQATVASTLLCSIGRTLLRLAGWVAHHGFK